MMEHFFRLLRRYCLQSTIVGLKYFYLYPDIVSRCFWAVNMIAVLVMSFLLTVLLYNRFAEMPTRVTIENQFEPVKNLPYPAITLCSPNQMTISSLKYFSRSLVDGNMTIDLETALPVIIGFYQAISGVDRNLLQHLQHLLDLNRYTITEVMGIMPQSCNRFMKRCSLEGKLYDCSELFKPILTTHGYCCAFNSPYIFNGKTNTVNPNFSNRTVNGVGITNALMVVVDYDLEDAIPGTLLNAGAVVVMYTDCTEFPSDDEEAVIDSKGESYHILQATYTYCSDEVQSLPLWSRKCYFEDERHLPFFRKYHNSDCDHMCYVSAVSKACGCFPAFLPNVRVACGITSIPCIMKVKNAAEYQYFTWSDCLSDLHNPVTRQYDTQSVITDSLYGNLDFTFKIEQFYEEDMHNWLSSRQCDCPRDCVSRRYRAEVTMGNFDALPYVLRNPYKGLILNASSTAMHFFFTNPVYTKQKQETVMSLTSLISNLGGVFGLLMGCSCISVLEIFFYIYLGIKNYVRFRLENWMRNTLRNNY